MRRNNEHIMNRKCGKCPSLNNNMCKLGYKIYLKPIYFKGIGKSFIPIPDENCARYFKK
jgi:hypothetical protein